MPYEDFAESYARKRDDDLLRLQLESENLSPDATVALMNELAKRQIGNAERLNAFREEEKHRRQREAKNPGNLFIAFRFGVGRWYFGKADKKFDASTGLEQFRTTVFIVLLWFPLIPTGTYLVQRKRGYSSRKIRILQKIALDWEQVLKVWAAAVAALLALILILRRL